MQMRTVVFVAGAVLMSLEMLASRILAPYFGNSIFVWGSLISVFLAALAVGYAVGGQVADRYPNRKTLALTLAIPGAITAVLPWITGPVNAFFAAINLGPRFGPLLAALTLFFVPGIFMGMASPFAIKLQVKELDTVGNTTGGLYAVSTLGSIVGTLGTSFFLISWLRVSVIVHLLGATLLLLAVGVAVTAGNQAAVGKGRPPAKKAQKSSPSGKNVRNNRKNGKHIGAMLLTIAVAAALGATVTAAADPFSGKIIYEKDSLYHHITVADAAGVRYLKFDASWQSAMLLNDSLRLYFPYTEFFHLGPLLNPRAHTALFVGLGGGSVPKNFRVNYPDLEMDVAEIDPAVIDVAKKYFVLHDDDKLHLYASDGRIFLKQSKTLYDMVFLDAYYADAIPFHLTTQEYLRELTKNMAPNGILVSNVISAVSGAKSKVFRSIYKTYQSVFAQVYAFPIGPLQGAGPETLQNIVLVAMKSAQKPDWAGIATQAKAQMKTMKMPSDLPKMLSYRLTTSVSVIDVPILTDDYAPVDSLLHF